MASAGLSKEQASIAWQPFLSWVAQQGSSYSVGTPEIGSNPAQSYWDVEATYRSGSRVIKMDDRAGASPVHAWWTGDEEQVGAFLYGYDSLWLPKSLLEKEAQSRWRNALFEASRYMETRLDFNKGLSGGTPDAIARSSDTATNPKVLNAFALCLIAHRRRVALSGIAAGPRPERGRKRRPGRRPRHRHHARHRAGCWLLCVGKQLFQSQLAGRILGRKPCTPGLPLRRNTIPTGFSLCIMASAARLGAMTASRGEDDGLKAPRHLRSLIYGLPLRYMRPV